MARAIEKRKCVRDGYLIYNIYLGACPKVVFLTDREAEVKEVIWLYLYYPRGAPYVSI